MRSRAGEYLAIACESIRSCSDCLEYSGFRVICSAGMRRDRERAGKMHEFDSGAQSRGTSSHVAARIVLRCSVLTCRFFRACECCGVEHPTHPRETSR